MSKSSILAVTLLRVDESDAAREIHARHVSISVRCFREAPKANRERITKSIETDGSPDSIFATRD